MTAPSVPTVITPDLVLAMTDATAQQADITMATSIVELVAGVSCQDLTVFAARNRAWIGKAIAYQAAWQLGQPDLFERVDVSSMSQDGLSMTPRDQLSLMLGPFARKALDRVSWRRSRTVRMGVGRATRLANEAMGLYGTESDEPLIYPTGQPGSPAYDPVVGWRPL